MVDKDDLKKKAIMRLSEKGKIPASYEIEALNNHEMKRIIEDLVIHQMELEIQNENMARLQIELEHSRNKYYRLFENSPTGFLTLDVRGIVIDLNKSSTTIIEKPKKNLQTKPFTLQIESDNHAAFFSNLRKAKQTGKKVKDELLLKNGKTVLFESLFVEDDVSEAFYMCSMTDVTDKKEIEK
ncbi:MAG TPA: PAS domain-containing protein, partial [Thermotogota bacterium]|nr:PAS domain-containing protein [Thermotogota bacterium]